MPCHKYHPPGFGTKTNTSFAGRWDCHSLFLTKRAQMELGYQPVISISDGLMEVSLG
jgi:hypothetical protein